MLDGAARPIHDHQPALVATCERPLRDKAVRQIEIEIGGEHDDKLSSKSSRLTRPRTDLADQGSEAYSRNAGRRAVWRRDRAAFAGGSRAERGTARTPPRWSWNPRRSRRQCC